eukprot:5710659-Pyramimonas_sp.AAC.1
MAMMMMLMLMMMTPIVISIVRSVVIPNETANEVFSQVLLHHAQCCAASGADPRCNVAPHRGP